MEVDQRVFVLPPGETEPRPLPIEHWATVDRIDDDAVWVLQQDEEDWGHDQPAPAVRHYNVYRVGLASMEVERVVEDLGQIMWLSDDRWLTVLHETADLHSDLLLVDPEAGTRQIIDRDVYVLSAAYQPAPSGSHVRLEGDTLLYAVRDPNHARTGIWQVAIDP